MGPFSALIYGVLQGFTEFFPVSSSAHLAILPKILNIQDPGLLFDLSMHVGTAFAVIMYFREDLKNCGFSLVKIIVRRSIAENFFVANLALTTLFSIVIILFLKHTAETYGRNSTVIAFNLIFFGLAMGLIDHIMNRKPSNSSLKTALNIKQSFWIGCFQAVSIFPGVSRSGNTLTICRLLGLERTEAVRYSFLLSLPLIIGGFFYKLFETKEAVTFLWSWSELLIGTSFSFITGFMSIHYFLKIIASVGLWAFTFYRILLAAIILLFI